MKKYLMSVTLIFICFISIVNSQTYSCDNLKSNLKVGSKGVAVTELQNILIQENYLNSEATGYFGNVTKNALAKWQKDNNIYSSGVLSSATLKAVINKFCSNENVTQITNINNTNTVNNSNDYVKNGYPIPEIYQGNLTTYIINKIKSEINQDIDNQKKVLEDAQNPYNQDISKAQAEINRLNDELKSFQDEKATNLNKISTSGSLSPFVSGRAAIYQNEALQQESNITNRLKSASEVLNTATTRRWELVQYYSDISKNKINLLSVIQNDPKIVLAGQLIKVNNVNKGVYSLGGLLVKSDTIKLESYLNKYVVVFATELVVAAIYPQKTASYNIVYITINNFDTIQTIIDRVN